MNDIDKFAKEGVFKILVGNKCDLIEKRQVSKERGKQLADSYGIPFIETSAKSNENIEKLFVDSTRAFIEKQLKIGNAGFTNKAGPSGSAVNLSSTKIEDAPKKKKCC
jgi:GTPase SAR1 family protein